MCVFVLILQAVQANPTLHLAESLGASVQRPVCPFGGVPRAEMALELQITGQTSRGVGCLTCLPWPRGQWGRVGQAPADRPQPAASSAESPSTRSSLGIRFQEGVCECVRRNWERRRRKLQRIEEGSVGTPGSRGAHAEGGSDPRASHSKAGAPGP